MDQVYIFDFGDKIKVGFSTNVQKRLRTIELSSGVKAKQVYSVPASRKEEKLLHSWLNNRLEGEFFAFSFDEAQQILDKIIRGDITSPPNVIRTQGNGRIVYNKLFHLLKAKGKTMYDLRKDKVVGTATLEKMRKTEGHIDTRSIESLCKYLDCQPGDLMEYIPDEK